jgi:hypothetical protein
MLLAPRGGQFAFDGFLQDGLAQFIEQVLLVGEFGVEGINLLLDALFFFRMLC